MKRGFAAELPRAVRILLTALLRLLSKSTKVPSGHSLACSSLRVTMSPGFSSSAVRISNGWSSSFMRMPYFLNSRSNRYCWQRWADSLVVLWCCRSTT